MNILKNFLNALKNIFVTKTEMITEDAAKVGEYAVYAPIEAIETVEVKAEEVSDAVKTYVRDELGRFSKASEASPGPHGSWDKGGGANPPPATDEGGIGGSGAPAA